MTDSKLDQRLGRYVETPVAGEIVRAFVPPPLPPKPQIDVLALLDRLSLAFSRDRDEKVYVQHRMLEQGAELWRWLAEGAHFYVCGDARHMGKDVDRTLREIVARHSGLKAAAAADYVEQMAQEKRYVRDVY